MRTTPYTFALSASLLTLFPASVRLQAISNQTVTAIDARITYDGDWTVQDNGGHVFTSVAGSFALNFAGSAVYWYSRKLYNGAVAAITLDDDDIVYIDLSDGVGQNDTTLVAVLYEKEGLEMSGSHHLNVTWNGPGSNAVGSFLESYRVEFTGDASEPSTSSSSSASSSASSLASISASTPTKSNVGAIAGGTVGGIFSVLILISALLCLRNRRARIAAGQNMQSATPVFLFRNPNSGSPIASFSSASSVKPPLDGQPRLPSQRGDSRSYVPANPTNATTLLSPGTSAPPVSLPNDVPNSSRFGFAHGWERWRPESTSRTQSSALRSPQETSASAGTFIVGRDYSSANGPATTIPMPLPHSSGSTDHEEALVDPPPVYRD